MSIFNRVRQQAQQDAMNKAVPDASPAADAGMEKMPTVKPDAPAGAPVGYDGSGYGTTSGYLLNAARYIAPQVQAAKSEADAKSVSENFLRSLLPELQKRGENIGQIKGDKIQVGGHWIDLFRDIGTASDPQYMDLDAGGGGGQPGAGLADLIRGTDLSALTAPSAPAGGSGSNLKEILDQIQATANAPSDQQQPAQNDLVAQAQAVRDQARRDAVTRGFARGA